MFDIKTLVVGPFMENTFLVVDPESRDGVIVDPGEEAGRILAAVESTGMVVHALLITHGHLDHIGGLARLRRNLSAPVHLHEADREIYIAAPRDGLMFGIAVDRPPEPDVLVDEGMVVEAGTLSFRVIHTPGHTPGHVTYLIDDHAFVGDCIFADAIGRTDLPGGDFDTLAASIRGKLLTLPDDTIIHSGHGPDTTIGRERLSLRAVAGAE